MFLREAAYVPMALARQYRPPAKLRRWQVGALNAALAHAVRHVPYYRDRPTYHRLPLTSLAELGTLPLVTKAQLRELSLTTFLADNVDRSRCREFHTSGTTGHRVTVLHDQASCAYQNAAMVRRLAATGRYRPTHRLAHFRALPADRHRLQRLGLFRRYELSTAEPVAQWREALLAYRPHALVGYPVHLRELLRALSPADLRQLRRKLRLVMSESELLVEEHRAGIAASFGVPVFDEYSSFETLHIYYECAEGGRHIAEDRVYVEIVDERGEPVPDGTSGQVVCTAFQARAMPLLRYAMGDLGMIDPDPCRCGRRFRTMRLTRGRLNDSIVLPDGRRMFADRFLVIAAKQAGVAELLVRQDAAGAVRVQLVPDQTVPVASLLETIRQVVQKEAGQRLDLHVEAVARIPLTPGGKGKFAHSELTTTTDDGGVEALC